MKWKRPDWTRGQDSVDESVFLRLNDFSVLRYPVDTVPRQYENPRKKKQAPSLAGPLSFGGVPKQLAKRASAGSHDRRRLETVEDAFDIKTSGSDKHKRLAAKKYAKQAAKSIVRSPKRAAGWTLGSVVINSLYTLNKADDAVVKTRDWRQKRKESKRGGQPSREQAEQERLPVTTVK